jgi:hypothetical protein
MLFFLQHFLLIVLDFFFSLESTFLTEGRRRFFFFFYSSAASALPKNGNILFPLSGVLVQCPLLSFTQTNTCLFTASL